MIIDDGQLWKVTKYFLLKYNFKVVYLSISIICYFILLHYIYLTAVVTSYVPV